MYSGVNMAELPITTFVVVFAVLSLYDPKLYRKFLAPLCSMREDDLPVFPRSAALALLVFFGFFVLVPTLLRAAVPYTRILQQLRDWLVAIAFLVVGLGLLINPRACLHTLRWPHSAAPKGPLVSRVVGALLLVGCVLFIKSEMLHR
jgi:hypothetical protein